MFSGLYISAAPSLSMGAVANASIFGIGSPSGVLRGLGVVSLLSHADEGGSPIGGNVHAKVLKSLSSMIAANFLKYGWRLGGMRSFSISLMVV